MSPAEEIFNKQQQHALYIRGCDAAYRKDRLEKLKRVLLAHENDIYQALHTDLRKPRFEAALTEVYFIYAELDYAIKHVEKWMRPRKVGSTLTSFFTRNRIVYEPRGTSLIIAPWNYPFQLALSPLISALAAGNTVMLKPSELSPATSTLLYKMISENFTDEEVACFEGDAEVATNLLKLPFDHIFFTGSTRIGKKVMEAAAQHLSSVTLELGGKSPVIVASDADLDKAAQKIVWGKFLNAGQTCIAPDYILADEVIADELSLKIKQQTEALFLKDGKTNPASYGRIINRNHFNRLSSLLHDAVTKGANIKFGGEADEEALEISPTLLTGVDTQSAIMQEEIFGPLLPLLTFTQLDDALAQINKGSKPLALYAFTKNDKLAAYVIKNSSAGGTCVNDVLIHIGNPKLPFGGVGASGMGSCHGFFGFKAFSHERAVVHQSRIDFSTMAYPPYEGKNKQLSWIKKLL